MSTATPLPPPATPKKPPAPPSPPPTNGSAPRQAKTFSASAGVKSGAKKVVIYGPGGVGKSKLCSLLEEKGVKPLFLDIDEGTKHLNVSRVDGIETFQDVRDALHDQSLMNGFGAIVIDSATKLEELATAWVVANVKHEKPEKPIRGIEDYGFGKGFTHIYEQVLLVLSDLDAIYRRGKHIIITAHDCTANVPNPAGEDWIRYEPRLQSPQSGKASIRLRVKEWADYLAFVGYDASVNTNGKAVGGGTRTIYTQELPFCMAKNRGHADPIVYEDGSCEFWDKILD